MKINFNFIVCFMMNYYIFIIYIYVLNIIFFFWIKYIKIKKNIIYNFKFGEYDKFYICNFKFNIWIEMLWCFLVKLGYDLWYRKWFVVFFILSWGLFELIKIIFDCVFVVSNIWFVYNVVGCVKGYLGIFWIN